MADKGRNLLQRGNVIRLGENDYEIVNVTGEGGGCAAYTARRVVNGAELGFVIKELYPHELINHIEIDSDGVFRVSGSKLDIFEAYERAFVAGARNGALLFGVDCEHFLGHAKIYREYGTAYAVTELRQGAVLNDIFRLGKYSMRDISEIMVSVCNSLSFIHAQKSLYLDIKPSNIFIRRQSKGESIRAALFDFDSIITLTDTRNGAHTSFTEEWAAPELMSSTRVPITYAADIYPLGMLFYWLMAGETPGNGVISNVYDNRFEFLNYVEILRDFPDFPLVERILRSTLAVAPSKRVQSVEKLRTAFVRLVEASNDSRYVIGHVDKGITEYRETAKKHGHYGKYACVCLTVIAVASVVVVGTLRGLSADDSTLSADIPVATDAPADMPSESVMPFETENESNSTESDTEQSTITVTIAEVSADFLEAQYSTVVDLYEEISTNADTYMPALNPQRASSIYPYMAASALDIINFSQMEVVCEFAELCHFPDSETEDTPDVAKSGVLNIDPYYTKIIEECAAKYKLLIGNIMNGNVSYVDVISEYSYIINSYESANKHAKEKCKGAIRPELQVLLGTMHYERGRARICGNDYDGAVADYEMALSLYALAWRMCLKDMATEKTEKYNLEDIFYAYKLPYWIGSVYLSLGDIPTMNRNYRINSYATASAFFDEFRHNTLDWTALGEKVVGDNFENMLVKSSLFCAISCHKILVVFSAMGETRLEAFKYAKTSKEHYLTAKASPLIGGRNNITSENGLKDLKTIVVRYVAEFGDEFAIFD